MAGGSIVAVSSNGDMGSGTDTPLPRQELNDVRSKDSSAGRKSQSQQSIPVSVPAPGPVRLSSSRSLGVSVSLPEKPRWEQGMTVLLVDDSAPNRKVLRRLLVSQGHRVVEAVDGLEFLKQMEESFAQVAKATETLRDHLTAEQLAEPKSHYDVVLMDHLMPRMNGSEATKAIREKGYKGLIVGLTGHMLESDVNYFKSNGVNEVLPKPLKLDDLKRIVAGFYDVIGSNS